jgi:hypothetical protein
VTLRVVAMANFKRIMVALTVLGAVIFTLAVVRADHAGNADPDVVSMAGQMAAAANAILATVADGPTGIESAVGYDRRALLQLDFTDDARANYVYWPYLRKGLPLEYMTAQQKFLTHDLLNTALSAKGYLSAIQVMQLEKLLADAEVVGFPRGSENYTLAIFGSPGMDSDWGWRFEGHHLSLNFAVANGEISVTPTFFGASPAAIRTGTLAGFRSQHYVHDAGLALVNALSDAQRAVAIEDGNPPFDIVSGTLNRPRGSWDDWKSLPETGIAISSLDAQQKQLVQHILDEVVTVYRPEISRAYLAQVDVNELRFTWYGSTLGNEAHYWRLDGPDFFFEYDLVQGDGNHVHAVWRSKQGDFGADLLMQHRAESH